MTDKLLCDEKHRSVEATLHQHENHLERLDDTVDKLSTSAARTDAIVQTVCKKIDVLITTLISSVIALLGGAVTFVIWYIQNIPR